MRNIFVTLFYFSCMPLMMACRTEYVNSRFDIPSKELTKEYLRYRRQYEPPGKNIIGDTTISRRNLTIDYRNGHLCRIGKYNNEGQPMGYWFGFSTNGQSVKYVVHYLSNRSDSFPSPFALINEAW